MSKLAAGTIINNRYVVECVLGQGAMAIVYRVRHIHLKTPHAMKMLMMPSNTVQERLMQEGRVQASLNHKNVVSVTDIVEIDGASALVMEYIDGPSLDELLSTHQLSLEQADDIGRGIIQGVAAAHAHGLIHRDLKPANVMLALSDAGPTPKVADFGLAKILVSNSPNDMTATRSGIAMGTPAYMAPEQFRDAKSVDARADIFSVGAILYEIVCGERAFKGDNFLEMYQVVSEGKFTKPSEIRPEMPERMEKAILGAMSLAPEERISTCMELLEIWCEDTQVPQTKIEPIKTSATRSGAWDKDSLERVAALGSKDNLGIEEVEKVTKAMKSGSGETWFGADESIHVGSSTPGVSNPVATQEMEESITQPPRRGISATVLIGFAAVIVVGILVLVGAAATFLGGNLQTTQSSSSKAPPTAEADTPPAVVTPTTATGSSDAETTPSSSVETQVDEEAKPEPTEVVPTASPKETPKPKARPAKTAPKEVSKPVVNPETTTEKESDEVSESTPPNDQEGTATPVDEPPLPPPVKKKEGPPAGLARVTVSGDAQRVWLANSSGNFDPGDLKPGTYKILALFQGKDPKQVGEITLIAGKTHAIRCQGMFSVCR
jgi:serine/threonine-protein kinase